MTVTDFQKPGDGDRFISTSKALFAEILGSLESLCSIDADLIKKFEVCFNIFDRIAMYGNFTKIDKI